MIVAAFALVLALGFAWRLGWLAKLRPMPKGAYIGPIIGGKNWSAGAKLERVGDAYRINIPQAPGHLHALVIPASLVGKTRLAVRYRIEGDGTVHPREHPSLPGEISLMMQCKGDDWSGQGRHTFSRLYAPGPQFIRPGEHTLEADLTDPAGWIAPVASSVPALPLADVVNVQVCFGGYTSRAHGVFARGPVSVTLWVDMT